MTFLANGDVRIGAATPPVAKLDVAGEVKIASSGLSCGSGTTGALRYSGGCVQFCNGSAWNCIAPAPCSDLTPNQFSIPNLANQATSTLVESAIVQISGLGCAVTAQISGDGGAEFRVCSNSSCSAVEHDWGVGPVYVENGRRVQLRLTTPVAGGTTHQAIMSVGNRANTWSAFTAPADCSGIPPIGSVCPDGTVYAGQSPDGNVKMYTTRCNIGQTWTGMTCAGISTKLMWNNGTPNPDNFHTGINNPATGAANTAALAAAVDSHSPYYAALACYCLGETHGNAPDGTVPPECAGNPAGTNMLDGYGYDDWYLPASSEILLFGYSLLSNSTWTSQEHTGSSLGRDSCLHDVSSGDIYCGGSPAFKTQLYGVRCVRKE